MADERPAVIRPTGWIVAVVFAAVAAGIVAMGLNDRWGRFGPGLGERFEYQIDAYKHIDPAWLRWHKQAEFASQAGLVRAVAVGPEGRIYLGGQHGIEVFDLRGTPAGRLPAASPVYCLALEGEPPQAPRRLYVGLKDHVEVWDREGRVLQTWPAPSPRSVLTSIALVNGEVFVADAGTQAVYRFSAAGKRLGRIGSNERGGGGFVVPSPFFDVAPGPEGGLYVVNPGALRIETRTRDGVLRAFWGESSAGIEGFFGCCNPANLAVLPDGRLVTAEKGLLRVKVYTPEGTLDSVVAGPDQLESPGASAGLADHEYTAVDVATDPQGRVIVADRNSGVVRVFEEKR